MAERQLERQQRRRDYMRRYMQKWRAEHPERERAGRIRRAARLLEDEGYRVQKPGENA